MKTNTKPYEKQMFYSIKSYAKKKSIGFNLEPSDIRIPSRCPVLGMRLKDRPGPVGANTPCVTRIDNTLGYTIDNIEVVSKRAHSIMSRYTKEDLESVIKYYKDYIR